MSNIARKSNSFHNKKSNRIKKASKTFNYNVKDQYNKQSKLRMMSKKVKIRNKKSNNRIIIRIKL